MSTDRDNKDEKRSACQQHCYDLVITDLMMPEMNGADLVQALHARSPETQVIVMTAYGTGALRGQVPEGALAGCLEKPFSIEELLESVARARERGRGR